jgi:asparagine synthase (glutamine-hydrolysing)
VAHFRELFADAVRERTRDGTPAGPMLSGGLDSGAVAAVAGDLADRGVGEGPPLRTYQWAFEGMPGCDERAVSRRVAGRWDLPQVDVPVEGAWPLAGGLRHGPDPDEPFAGVYQPMIDRTLARAADDGCRRLLSGDRGDLLMGEYVYDFPALALSGRWIQLWSELRRLADRRGVAVLEEARRQLLRPLRHTLWPPERSGPVRDAVRRARRALRPRVRRLPPWVGPDLGDRAGASGPGTGDPREVEALAGLRGQARKSRYRAITMPFQMQVMTWSERSWARHGLEFADPWSDVRLARFALSVPQRVLNRVGEDKRLVRRAMDGLVPDDALRRMGKVSPAPLLYRALRQEEVATMEDLLTDMEAARRGWLREEALRAHYREIREGDDMHPHFWSAVNLEMWLRARSVRGGSGAAAGRPAETRARARA